MMMTDAYVEGDEANQSLCYITCQLNQVSAWDLWWYFTVHTGTNFIHLVYLTGWKVRFLRKKARFAKIFVECLTP